MIFNDFSICSIDSAVLLLKCPITSGSYMLASQQKATGTLIFRYFVLNMFLVDSMIATYPQMVPVIVSI